MDERSREGSGSFPVDGVVETSGEDVRGKVPWVCVDTGNVGDLELVVPYVKPDVRRREAWGEWEGP